MLVLRRILVFALLAVSLSAGGLVLVASKWEVLVSPLVLPLVLPVFGVGRFLIVVIVVAMAIVIGMRIGVRVGAPLLKIAGVALWSYAIGTIFIFIAINDVFTPTLKTDEFSGLGAALSTNFVVPPLEIGRASCRERV